MCTKSTCICTAKSDSRYSSLLLGLLQVALLAIKSYLSKLSQHDILNFSQLSWQASKNDLLQKSPSSYGSIGFFSFACGVCTSKSIYDNYSKFLICHTEKKLPQNSSVSKDYFPKSSIVWQRCNFECIEARRGTFKNINWLI